METAARSVLLKFTTRKMGSRGSAEVVHFYGPSRGRVFHARCDRGFLNSFLERVGAEFEVSKTGRTIYIEGSKAEEVFRRLVILAGSRQCIKSSLKAADIASAVVALGEFETIFWFSKLLEEYEKSGYRGVCRVSKSFRVMYRVD